MMPCGLTRSCRNLLFMIMTASRIGELLSSRATCCHHGGGRGVLFVHVPAPPTPARLARFRTSGLWTSDVYHQNAQGAGRCVFRRSSNGCGRTQRVVHNRCWSRMDATAAGDQGGGRHGPRPKKRPLVYLGEAVNDAILEMCVVNKGRPLARSMTDFVEYSIEALASGELLL